LHKPNRFITGSWNKAKRQTFDFAGISEKQLFQDRLWLVFLNPYNLMYCYWSKIDFPNNDSYFRITSIGTNKNIAIFGFSIFKDRQIATLFFIIK
jgi:hypothetical protein